MVNLEVMEILLGRKKLLGQFLVVRALLMCKQLNDGKVKTA